LTLRRLFRCCFGNRCCVEKVSNGSHACLKNEVEWGWGVASDLLRPPSYPLSIYCCRYQGILERSDQTCLNFLLMCGPPTGVLPLSMSNDDTVQKYLVRVEKRHLKDWPWNGKNRWPNALMYNQSCPLTTGLNVAYGVLTPDRFQTGHKKYGKTKWKRKSFEDPTSMYHGNYLFVSPCVHVKQATFSCVCLCAPPPFHRLFSGEFPHQSAQYSPPF
jgi:hypothetical protein